MNNEKNMLRASYRILGLALCSIVLMSHIVMAQHTGHHHGPQASAPPLTEKDYYRIETVNMPESILPEVGGLVQVDDGSMAFVTRRGELWIVHDPSGQTPYYTLFASGLHEPLGLHYQAGSFYVAQRAELTRITDTDGDGQADRFETLANWPLSGNYCEYNHGPVLANDGNFYINMNLGDNGMGNGREEPFYGEMGHHAKWRGWIMQVSPEGELKPYAAGLRSPAGIGTNAEGELFYTENQGGWVGTGFVTHVEEGDFFGHPSSLKSAREPESNIDLTIAAIPRDAPLFHQAAQQIKGSMKMPSVRIPHGVMGTSTAGLLADKAGFFGEVFKDQLFVGDQGQANIVRIAMEKVNGAYQGAVFPFLKDFASGILRMAWGADGSLFVGMSDRGWNSIGAANHGLQRIVWTGKTPFEILKIHAKTDGFEIHFTSPVDEQTALDPHSYVVSSFDYQFHERYGSDVEDLKEARIAGIRLSPDKKSVRLILDEMRAGYIYEVRSEGVRQTDGGPALLHPLGYYSLNSIPTNETINADDLSVTWIPEPEEEVELPVVVVEEGEPVRETTKSEPRPRRLAKRTTEMPEWWANGPDKTVHMGTLPGLLFSITQIDVKPGAKVKLVFNNNDDMLHNLLIVAAGASDELGMAALKLGLEGSKMQYVPKSDKVLYHTNLLQPGSTETIYFEAPLKPGRYEYVCTYPGHFQIMRGILNVQ